MSGVSSTVRINDGMTPALRSMNRALNIVLSSFERMQSVSSRSIDTSDIVTARAELNSAASAVNRLEQEFRQAGDAADNLNNNTNEAASSVGGLIKKVGGLAAAYASVQSIGAVVNVSDRVSQTTSKLELIVDDNESVKELEQKIMASANRSRAAYLDTAESIARIANNTGDVFKSNDEIIAFMETVNKQFVLGGTSAAAASGAMTQLVQGLAAGALRGDELNSVLEGAPGIARAIEESMGWASGSIKNYAEQGLVTAEVVKNAMLSSADQVNKDFESMDMTWGQVMTRIKNEALVSFEPVLKKVNELANNPKIQSFALSFINALSMVGVVALNIFDIVVGAASVIADNWSWISPIVYGVAIALGIYTAALIAYNTIQAISNGLKAIAAARETILAAKTAMSTGATFAATAAQYGFNAALYACPLTWIILIIIAAIAAIYAIVAAINHFAGTSLSATGLIVGYFYALYAKIANYFILLWNSIVDFVNFFANVFNDPVASVKMLFLGLTENVIGYVIEMARAIENIINKIPGVNIDITSGLDNFRDSVKRTAEKVKNESEWKEVVSKKDFLDISEYAQKGYSKGQKVESNVKDKISNIMDGLKGSEDKVKLPEYESKGIGDIAKNTKDTSKNTGSMADSMEITDEDVKYLRDMAEKEAINRFTTASIKIDMQNTNNINSGMDIDGFVGQLESKLLESMERSAEGVH